MNKKTFILVLIIAAFTLNACEKDTDVFVPDPNQLIGPDTNWHTAIPTPVSVASLRNSLLIAPYLDTITVNAGSVTINTPFGIQVTFPPHCCTNGAGQNVTGKVDVEMQMLKKKGDMIRLDKPSTYNDTMLLTAGEIFIQLKKDGQALQLAPNVKINVRYVDLPVNQQMEFFVGDETNAARFNWLPNPDPVNNTVVTSPQAYEISTNRLRWISLAQVFDLNTVAKVKVSADIAPYFTNSNTVSFAVFKDLRSVVSMPGDINTRQFVSPKLPVGKQITVVVLSKQGNDHYLGYESAITQLPGVNLAQQVKVVPVKRSVPEIIAYLNSL